MKLTEILKNNRTSKATIGLSSNQFYSLLTHFEQVLEKFDKIRLKSNRLGRKPVLKTMEEKLFFVLYYLKTYPTFDVLGANFGMSKSRACPWIHYYSKILYWAMKKGNFLPKRRFKNKEEFQKAFPNLKFLIADGTERPKRRPQNNEKQKEFYSGKKKRHTMKNLCISDQKKKIVYSSSTVPGKEHDKTIFLNKKLHEVLPDSVKKLFDLAFYGLENNCPDMANIIMPHKKPKKKELTSGKKKENKRISRKRVIVENAFAGVKRLKITYDVFRNTKVYYPSLVFFLACGLWNFIL